MKRSMQVARSLRTSVSRLPALKLATMGVLCCSAIGTHAAPPVAQVSFAAMIERVSAPEGVAVPAELSKGTRVDGSISFLDGNHRDLTPVIKGYTWLTPDSNERTASVHLKAPLDSSMAGAFFVVNLPPAEKIVVNCNPSYPCNYDGGIALGSGSQIWQPAAFSLQAAGAVSDGLSQQKAVERLTKIANGKQSKILVTYKEKPEDSGAKAIRVVLLIESMKAE